MKKTKVLYWVFTGLISALMLSSSVPSVLRLPQAVDFMTKLGYPGYIVPFLGVAKILGVAAILIPGFPRIKEWAYAGLCIDLVGATYSLIAIGTPVTQWIFMLIWIILLFVSYVYYHKRLAAIKKGN